MIRRATPGDAKRIEALAREAVASVDYGRLRLDSDRLRASISLVLSDRRHYCAVCEVDGGVTGCIAVLTTETLWSERRVAKLALWWAPSGGGLALLKSAVEWVKSRPGIVAFSAEFDFRGQPDPRVGRLLSRYGFEPMPGAFVRYG